MFRVSAIFLAMGVLYVLAADVQLISDKYDYINIDEILSNDRLRGQYYKCFTGAGPCLTPDAKFFKDFLPEAIATQCRRCTEKQKIMLEKSATWYTEHDSNSWDELIAKMIENTKTNKAAMKKVEKSAR